MTKTNVTNIEGKVLSLTPTNNYQHSSKISLRVRYSHDTDGFTGGIDSFTSHQYKIEVLEGQLK